MIKTLSLSVEATRAVDRYAIENLRVPGVVLMENAGRNAADLIQHGLVKRLGDARRAGRVAIVCGKGNNGGDGFVIARHLAHRGFEVAVDLIGKPEDLAGDAATNHAIVAAMKVPIRKLDAGAALKKAVQRWGKCDALVDAILGTGFDGEVRDPQRTIIGTINDIRQTKQKGGPLVVAVDVPSGLNADTGEPGGVAVNAHRTVTFVAMKKGYETRTAKRYLGRCSVVDIGAPTALILKKLRHKGS